MICVIIGIIVDIRKLTSIYFSSEKLSEIPHADINFLHIGKCGGTTVRRSLQKSKINRIFHQSRPALNTPKNARYFFFLRHPLTRIASAFSHCRDVALFPTEGVDPSTLNIHNCPAPVRIQKKILNSKQFAYSEEFESLLLEFPDVNALGEGLASSNSFLRNRAISLLEFPKDNIFKGIGWYLHNGKFVKRNNSQIFFVGATEFMDKSMSLLHHEFDLIKEDCKSFVAQVRRSSNKVSSNSSLFFTYSARKALLCYLDQTDLKALRSLRKASMICEELYDTYTN